MNNTQNKFVWNKEKTIIVKLFDIDWEIKLSLSLIWLIKLTTFTNTDNVV